MTNTYTPLANITLTSTDAEIVFSSIPATYRDLIVVFAGTSTGSGDVVLSFNGDTTNTYPNVQMFGTGSSAISASFTRTGAFVSFASTTQNNFIAQIMDYSASDKQKTVLSRYNVSTSETSAQAGRWPSNNAITSVAVRMTTQAFATGSVLSLYGVIA